MAKGWNQLPHHNIVAIICIFHVERDTTVGSYGFRCSECTLYIEILVLLNSNTRKGNNTESVNATINLNLMYLNPNSIFMLQSTPD